MALNQCLTFFREHPELERVPFYDTAGSVKMLMEDGPEDAAAIASSIAAGIYGAHILKRGIEDDRQNFTRFFLLARPGTHEAAEDGQGVEDLAGLHHSQYSRGTVPVAQRLCSARPEPDEDRIAASARQAVGVPVLSRLPGTRR